MFFCYRKTLFTTVGKPCLWHWFHKQYPRYKTEMRKMARHTHKWGANYALRSLKKQIKSWTVAYFSACCISKTRLLSFTYFLYWTFKLKEKKTTRCICSLCRGRENKRGLSPNKGENVLCTVVINISPPIPVFMSPRGIWEVPVTRLHIGRCRE